MPVLLAEKSLSTHTVDGVLTVEVLSLERISPRSIDLPHTSPVGSQSLWLTPSLLAAHLSNSHTPLVLLSHSLSSSTHTGPQTRLPMSLLTSSTRTSTSDLVLSSRSSTWPSQSTSRLPRTVTSPIRTSAGRSPRFLIGRLRHTHCHDRFMCKTQRLVRAGIYSVFP
jgi:hypothetical protein